MPIQVNYPGWEDPHTGTGMAVGNTPNAIGFPDPRTASQDEINRWWKAVQELDAYAKANSGQSMWSQAMAGQSPVGYAEAAAEIGKKYGLSYFTRAGQTGNMGYVLRTLEQIPAGKDPSTFTPSATWVASMANYGIQNEIEQDLDTGLFGNNFWTAAAAIAALGGAGAGISSLTGVPGAVSTGTTIGITPAGGIGTIPAAGGTFSGGAAAGAAGGVGGDVLAGGAAGDTVIPGIGTIPTGGAVPGVTGVTTVPYATGASPLIGLGGAAGGLPSIPGASSVLDEVFSGGAGEEVLGGTVGGDTLEPSLLDKILGPGGGLDVLQGQGGNAAVNAVLDALGLGGGGGIIPGITGAITESKNLDFLKDLFDFQKGLVTDPDDNPFVQRAITAIDERPDVMENPFVQEALRLISERPDISDSELYQSLVSAVSDPQSLMGAEGPFGALADYYVQAAERAAAREGKLPGTGFGGALNQGAVDQVMESLARNVAPLYPSVVQSYTGAFGAEQNAYDDQIGTVISGITPVENAYTQQISDIVSGIYPYQAQSIYAASSLPELASDITDTRAEFGGNVSGAIGGGIDLAQWLWNNVLNKAA